MSTLSGSTVTNESPVSPMSPRSATILIQANMEDPAVLNAVAQSLIETICKREREQREEQAEARQLIQDLQARLNQQQDQPLSEQCPEGYCLNRDR